MNNDSANQAAPVVAPVSRNVGAKYTWEWIQLK